MLKPPQRPGSTPPARALAPHVQAAVGRTAQARMPERASLPVRQPAAHVQAAVQRVAQPKPVAAPAPRRVIPPPPVPPPRSAPQAVPNSRTGTVQRMMQGPVVAPLPANQTGMQRDGETVKTVGGTWKAKRYAAVTRLSGAAAWGATMNLEFTPEAPVNATRIALVQSVIAVKNQVHFYHGSLTTQARASAEGASIDQAPESRSPLYADDPDQATGALGTAPLQPGAGEHGHRYKGGFLGLFWQVKPAWLRDTPHFRGVHSFSSQIFETTALAVAGQDQGTYYGSVSWGWYTQDGSDVYIYPLKVESRTSATPQFQESVTRWNQTLTDQGETPQQLPDVP